MPNIQAKSLKITVVLDAASLLTVACPEGGSARTVLNIRTPDRSVSADIASKAIRKAQAMLDEHGTDAVVCLIQGRLAAGDRIAEAGLVAQVKAPKVPAEAAA
jgi:hypothetical protein